MTSNDPTLNLRHWAVLLLTAALFGSSFLLINLSVDAVPPLTIAAIRATLAAAAVWAILRLAGGRMPPPGPGWAPLALLGLLTGVIPFTAIAWGQAHIDSGLAGILFGTIPVFTVLLAPLLARDERLTSARLIGAAVGFGGVVLVIGPNALNGLDGQMFGAAITLLAALSYALGAIYARRRRDLSPLVMAAGQLLVATIVLVPLSLAVDRPWSLTPEPSHLLLLGAVGLLSTAVPMVLLFWLIRQVGATNGSLTTFFMPVVAVVLGAALLGERLPWQAFAGLTVILLGAAAMNGRFRFLAGAAPGYATALPAAPTAKTSSTR